MEEFVKQALIFCPCYAIKHDNILPELLYSIPNFASLIGKNKIEVSKLWKWLGPKYINQIKIQNFSQHWEVSVQRNHCGQDKQHKSGCFRPCPWWLGHWISVWQTWKTCSLKKNFGLKIMIPNLTDIFYAKSFGVVLPIFLLRFLTAAHFSSKIIAVDRYGKHFNYMKSPWTLLMIINN